MNKFLRDEVVNALIDYKYLLNRGYNQKPSLDLVTSHYRLSRSERMMLFRCVHSDLDSTDVCSRVIDLSEIPNHRLVIDGFNTLLTITSVIEGDFVYLCDDCFMRDLRSAKIKEFESDSIKRAASTLMNYIKALKPLDVVVVLDKQVSKSGEFRNELSEMLDNVKVVLASKADITVLMEGGVIASSDFVILKRANKVFDIAGYIIMSEFRDKVIDIKEIWKAVQS
ncbi:MAG: DUF434 domain-containing protein [Sulfolobales archaeon]|nr:DUF434 domain-containing protein [Sulfolobales archaeon]